MRKPRVVVQWRGKAIWIVGIEGRVIHPSGGEWGTIVVATFETRASANEYAKGLRRALRGGA